MKFDLVRCLSLDEKTAGFGVSANPAGTSSDTAHSSADTALYHAKRSGRNSVDVADEQYC